MRDFDGDFGSARGRREALENVRHQDALQKRSGTVAGNTTLLARLTAMTTVDAAAERSLEGTLGALRKVAQLSPMRKAAAERQGTDFDRPPRRSSVPG